MSVYTTARRKKRGLVTGALVQLSPTAPASYHEPGKQGVASHAIFCCNQWKLILVRSLLDFGIHVLNPYTGGFACGMSCCCCTLIACLMTSGGYQNAFLVLDFVSHLCLPLFRLLMILERSNDSLCFLLAIKPKHVMNNFIFFNSDNTPSMLII